MNTRELATILWVAIIAVIVLVIPQSRREIGGALKHLRTWQLMIPLLLYAGFLTGIVELARNVGIWTSSLLAATLVWFFASGLTSLARAITQASKSQSYFRKYLRDLVGLAVLFEFFLNVKTLPLWIEMVLLPLIVLLAFLQALGTHDNKMKVPGQVAASLLAAIVLWLAATSIVGIVRDPDLSIPDLARQLLLPLWLGLAALPFIYVTAIAAGYETMFSRLKIFNDGASAPFKIRLGLASALKFDLGAIDRFAGQRGFECARARTFRQARNEVALFRSVRSEDQRRKAEARQRLVDMTDIEGTDEDGRQLDRREFEATKNALEYLHLCQSGHYRNKARYRSDILTVVDDFERQGLSAPHGIQHKMRKDGQAWMAYRRTASGYYFGIGASASPPSQWFFDGHRPPSGFPSNSGHWSDFMSDTRLEWKLETPL